jgi:hypothetical protein
MVEAEEGVSSVPACASNLRSDRVRFYRLQPDKVRVELVAAWKKETPSIVLRGFLDLLEANASWILKNRSDSIGSALPSMRKHRVPYLHQVLSPVCG